MVDGGCYFGMECDFVVVFVCEVEELGFDFVVGFGFVEFEWFEDWGVVFGEIKCVCGLLLEVEEMILVCEGVGIEFMEIG